MIRLPPTLGILAITPRSAHHDINSLEERTSTLKPKYKICGEIPPAGDSRAFFISTGNDSGKGAKYIVAVQQAEWIDRNPNNLHGTSYFSPQRVEILDAFEIDQKTHDKQNGFIKVATMPEKKYKELRRSFEMYRRENGDNMGAASRGRLDIAIAYFDPEDELKKLGL